MAISLESSRKTFDGHRIIGEIQAHASYPQLEKKTTKSTKSSKSSVSLRSSITPGTVLIILAGRFRGCRVVFLKQLDSGLLLVTGPYAFNGVPIKRVNQRYVIATSTKVDISGLKIDAAIDDSLFKKPSQKKSTDAKDMVADVEATASKDISERKKIQQSLDSQLIPLIKATPLLKSYIASRFSLKKGQYPHTLKF